VSVGVADIVAWLADIGITTPAFDGLYLVPKPDQAVFITMTGGTGLTFERSYDVVSFQLRCRGNPSPANPPAAGADAAAIASACDDAILAIVAPVQIGSAHVNDINRLGAPPRFALFDAAQRAEYVAAYTLSVARSVH
jgi:hypothetical protein